MFGKKKQKQETLVRMRNLAQLDEGFFAHMKDGKDMFDATAREIRETYQQLGAGITQIQENIKRSITNGSRQRRKGAGADRTAGVISGAGSTVIGKKEQMLQNFCTDRTGDGTVGGGKQTFHHAIQIPERISGCTQGGK